MDQSCHQMDCQALSRNIIHVFMDVHGVCILFRYSMYKGIKFSNYICQIIFFLNMLSYCVYLKYENHMNN